MFDLEQTLRNFHALLRYQSSMIVYIYHCELWFISFIEFMPINNLLILLFIRGLHRISKLNPNPFQMIFGSVAFIRYPKSDIRRIFQASEIRPIKNYNIDHYNRLINHKHSNFSPTDSLFDMKQYLKNSCYSTSALKNSMMKLIGIYLDLFFCGMLSISLEEIFLFLFLAVIGESSVSVSVPVPSDPSLLLCKLNESADRNAIEFWDWFGVSDNLSLLSK